MRYVAAYMLSALGGKENPTSGDVEKILGSVGIEADPEKLKIVTGELKGKNIEDLVTQGLEKLASMPTAAAAPAAAAPAAAAAAPEKKEEKEVKKEEPEEESDDDIGLGLFA